MLAECGADVVVHCRTRIADAEAMAQRLRGLGVRSQAMAAELSDRSAVENRQEFGPLAVTFRLGERLDTGEQSESSRNPLRHEPGCRHRDRIQGFRRLWK